MFHYIWRRPLGHSWKRFNESLRHNRLDRTGGRVCRGFRFFGIQSRPGVLMPPPSNSITESPVVTLCDSNRAQASVELMLPAPGVLRRMSAPVPAVCRIAPCTPPSVSKLPSASWSTRQFKSSQPCVSRLP